MDVIDTAERLGIEVCGIEPVLKVSRHPHCRRTTEGLIRPAHLNLVNAKEQSMNPVVIVDIVLAALTILRGAMSERQ